MHFNEIIYSKENRVATITLNRPAKLNAYSEVMVHEIIEALGDARVQPAAVGRFKGKQGPGRRCIRASSY